MKKAILIPVFVILLLIVGWVAWYLISPLFIVVQVDEASPLDTVSRPADEVVREPQAEIEQIDPDMEEKMEEEVEQLKDVVVEMNDEMPSASIVSQGTFMGTRYDVSGTSLLIDTPEGKVLRFEDFDTQNGPQLHVYLSTGTGDEDFIDLGPLQGTQGNLNINIPEDVDLETYDHVLIWCVPFGVLFGYSELV